MTFNPLGPWQRHPLRPDVLERCWRDIPGRPQLGETAMVPCDAPATSSTGLCEAHHAELVDLTGAP
ncbi:MAG: hypothetical protein M3Y91_14920 [Actinomycetota bacterium]|nr:hypothetical protein [Actinomycetota bacterium]